MKLILKNAYKTKLTVEQIEAWFERKKNESSAFGIRRYTTDRLNHGFAIRKKRFGSGAFPPTINLEYGRDNTVKIEIWPNFKNILFMGIFWILVPYMMFFSDSSIPMQKLTIYFAVIAFTTLVFFVLPFFLTRKWIESQLNLYDRKKASDFQYDNLD